MRDKTQHRCDHTNDTAIANLARVAFGALEAAAKDRELGPHHATVELVVGPAIVGWLVGSVIGSEENFFFKGLSENGANEQVPRKVHWSNAICVHQSTVAAWKGNTHAMYTFKRAF